MTVQSNLGTIRTCQLLLPISKTSIRNSGAPSNMVPVGSGQYAPLLVIAGAGSGKTNTLAHRVAHLIVQGAEPA